jgi:K+-sensing histidine kinase KdpD
MDINSRLKSVTDREKWAARGASFVAKLKATKVVWFPPEPAKAGKKTAAAAKKSTKRVTKKTTSAAKKTSTGATKAAKSPASAKTA